MFAGNFAPQGWAFCDGQLLAISDNDTLFSLIGTIYGGDGVNTFALPDLRGRVPLHQGSGPGLSTRTLGVLAGTESVTLTAAQLPAHAHDFHASTTAGASSGPQGNVVGNPPSTTMFIADTPTQSLPSTMLGPAGGSQPHENRMPFLAVNFIISLYGIYPSSS